VFRSGSGEHHTAACSPFGEITTGDYPQMVGKRKTLLKSGKFGL
jgi:hypothetical protein